MSFFKVFTGSFGKIFNQSTKTFAQKSAIKIVVNELTKMKISYDPNSLNPVDKFVDGLKKFVAKESQTQFEEDLKGSLTLKNTNLSKTDIKAKEIVKKLYQLYSERDSLMKLMSESTDSQHLLDYSCMIEDINEKMDKFIKKFNSTVKDSVQSKKEFHNSFTRITSKYFVDENQKKFVMQLHKDVNIGELDKNIENIENWTQNEAKRHEELAELVLTQTYKMDELANRKVDLSNLQENPATRDSSASKKLLKEISTDEVKLLEIRTKMNQLAEESKKELENVVKSTIITPEKELSIIEKLDLKIDEIQDLNTIYLKNKGNYKEFRKQLEEKFKNPSKVKALLTYLAFATQKQISSRLILLALGMLFFDPLKNLIENYMSGPDKEAETTITSIKESENNYIITSGTIYKQWADEFTSAAKHRTESLDDFQQEELNHFNELCKEIVSTYQKELNKIKPSNVNRKNLEENKSKIETKKKNFIEQMKSLKYEMNERTVFYKNRKLLATTLTNITQFIRLYKNEKIPGEKEQRHKELVDESVKLEQNYNVNKNVREAYQLVQNCIFLGDGNTEKVKNGKKSLLMSLTHVSDHCNNEINFVEKKLESKEIKLRELPQKKEIANRHRELKEKIVPLKNAVENNEISVEDAIHSLKEIYQEHTKEIKDLAQKGKKIESLMDDFGRELHVDEHKEKEPPKRKGIWPFY